MTTISKISGFFNTAVHVVKDLATYPVRASCDFKKVYPRRPSSLSDQEKQRYVNNVTSGFIVLQAGVFLLPLVSIPVISLITPEHRQLVTCISLIASIAASGYIVPKALSKKLCDTSLAKDGEMQMLPSLNRLKENTISPH